MTPSEAFAHLEAKGAVFSLGNDGAPIVRLPARLRNEASTEIAVLRGHRAALIEKLRRREPAVPAEDGLCRRCRSSRTFWRTGDARTCVECARRESQYQRYQPDGREVTVYKHGYEVVTVSGKEVCPTCGLTTWTRVAFRLWLSPCGSYWTGHHTRLEAPDAEWKETSASAGLAGIPRETLQ